MTKDEKLRKADAFKRNLVKICRKHGLTITPHHWENDYDYDDWLEISPIEYEGDTHAIEVAEVQLARGWKR